MHDELKEYFEHFEKWLGDVRFFAGEAQLPSHDELYKCYCLGLEAREVASEAQGENND